MEHFLSSALQRSIDPKLPHQPELPPLCCLHLPITHIRRHEMNEIGLEAHCPPCRGKKYSPSIHFCFCCLDFGYVKKWVGDYSVCHFSYLSSTRVQNYLNANGPPVYSSGGAEWSLGLIDSGQQELSCSSESKPL